jgi:transcriptional regulator with XRE-family HTH domain
MEKRNLPDRYTDLRVEKNLSQTDLAKALDCNKQYISKLESGERTISLMLLEKYADFFNVSTDYLLGRTDIKTNNTKVQDICKYTGLSENAILFMAKDLSVENGTFTRKEHTAFFSVLSKVIDNMNFFNVIVCIGHLLSRSSKLVNSNMCLIDTKDFLNLERDCKAERSEALDSFFQLLNDFDYRKILPEKYESRKKESEISLFDRWFIEHYYDNTEKLKEKNPTPNENSKQD